MKFIDLLEDRYSVFNNDIYIDGDTLIIQHDKHKTVIADIRQAVAVDTGKDVTIKVVTNTVITIILTKNEMRIL